MNRIIKFRTKRNAYNHIEQLMILNEFERNIDVYLAVGFTDMKKIHRSSIIMSTKTEEILFYGQIRFYYNYQ